MHCRLCFCVLSKRGLVPRGFRLVSLLVESVSTRLGWSCGCCLRGVPVVWSVGVSRQLAVGSRSGRCV